MDAPQAADSSDEGLRQQWLAQTHNLATTYVDLDQYRNAELRYREIEEYCRTADCDARTKILFRKGLASIARRQLRFSNAQDLLETLLADMQKMPRLPAGEFGLVYDELGWLQRDRGDWAAAELSFGTSIDSLEREGRRRRSTIPLVMRRLAEVRAAQGKTKSAREGFEAALAAQETLGGPDAPAVGVVLASYAEWLVATGHGERNPAAMLDRAVELLSKDPLLIGYRADAQATRARLHWKQGESSEAVRAMESALRDVEYLRAVSAFDASDRARVFSTRLDDSRDLIDWYFELGDQTAAWAQFERSRARALLDDLNAYRGLQPLPERAGAVPEELLAAQERVSAMRAALQHATALEEDVALRAYDAAYRQLLVIRARQAGSNFEPILPDDISPESVVDLDALRAEVLDEGEIMLAYSHGSSGTSLIVARHGGVQLDYRILRRSEGWSLEDALFTESAGTVSLLDRLRSYSHPFDRSMAESLEALGDFLVPRDLRDELEAASAVIVLPDGPLHHLPLEALVLEAGNDARETVFWLDRLPPVRYAPSATTLWALAIRSRSRESAESVLIVANPRFADGGEDQRFSALPNSIREAELLQARIGSTQLLSEEDATEHAFRRFAPDARILHLATHGVVETRAQHDVASLLLAPGTDRAGREDDGFLDLDEIAVLPLRAELTVLSACSSHEGKQVRGEGVFALTRAFLIAGSDRVVGTLWPVQDYATAWAMERFYGSTLGNSLEPASYAGALHEVKREIREQDGWEAPAYWAAFVSTGLR